MGGTMGVATWTRRTLFGNDRTKTAGTGINVRHYGTGAS